MDSQAFLCARSAPLSSHPFGAGAHFQKGHQEPTMQSKLRLGQQPFVF